MKRSSSGEREAKKRKPDIQVLIDKAFRFAKSGNYGKALALGEQIMLRDPENYTWALNIPNVLMDTSSREEKQQKWMRFFNIPVEEETFLFKGHQYFRVSGALTCLEEEIFDDINFLFDIMLPDVVRYLETLFDYGEMTQCEEDAGAIFENYDFELDVKTKVFEIYLSVLIINKALNPNLGVLNENVCKYFSSKTVELYGTIMKETSLDFWEKVQPTIDNIPLAFSMNACSLFEDLFIKWDEIGDVYRKHVEVNFPNVANNLSRIADDRFFLMDSTDHPFSTQTVIIIHNFLFYF